MSWVQDMIGDALAAEISSREEWDEMPAVLPMYLHAGRCHLGRLTIPDDIWRMGPPAVVLGTLADAAGDRAYLLQSIAPGELHGAAFFTEIWMASAPAGTPADEDLRRRARAAGGRVSEMPDRVEARSIWAVDRAGITYSAFQCRGEDEVKRAVWHPKAGRPGVAGEVPNALDRMVTAMLGVTLPARGRS